MATIESKPSCTSLALVTMAIGQEYADAVEPGHETKRSYCQRHGYTFYNLDKSLDEKRLTAWSKVLFLQNLLLTTEHQWFYWSDADSLIMNPAIPLESFLDDNYFLIVTEDFLEINTGQFFIKNCEKSVEFLKEVYSHEKHSHHRLAEQRAMMAELEQNPSWRDQIKILPQRMFNSYIKPYAGGQYQMGDFVLHLAGLREPSLLATAMERYFNLASLMQGECSKEQLLDSQLTLDRYLATQGQSLSTEVRSGCEHITAEQASQFERELAKHPEIQNIAKIGFYAGHSCEVFMRSLPCLSSLYSFDTGDSLYSSAAYRYFTTHKAYAKKFHPVKGDSRETVPAFAQSHLNVKFDLIYINGAKDYEIYFQDICNCRELAHAYSILWLNNWHLEEVARAIQKAVAEGIIEVDIGFQSESEFEVRAWATACYTS
ncbi:MAG: class I SAM-dependent methyltransferase [Verrucomicrobiota bacterium]|nr:class I SAM-dependent methyltransferase [Verrucomicrobiota bacterium]